MEDELRQFIDEFKIVVERRYIDNEPALEALYGDKVPVLTGDGAPDDGAGDAGDVYLDRSGLILYGPKTGGSWAS